MHNDTLLIPVFTKEQEVQNITLFSALYICNPYNVSNRQEIKFVYIILNTKSI